MLPEALPLQQPEVPEGPGGDALEGWAWLAEADAEGPEGPADDALEGRGDDALEGPGADGGESTDDSECMPELEQIPHDVGVEKALEEKEKALQHTKALQRALQHTVPTTVPKRLRPDMIGVSPHNRQGHNELPQVEALRAVEIIVPHAQTEALGPLEYEKALPEDAVLLRGMDAVLAQADPALLQMKNELVEALQAKEALEAKEAEEAREALEASLQAKKTTRAFLQSLLDPQGPDVFIESATAAQQALENMKNFAKDVKAQHILQGAKAVKEANEQKEAKELKEREERAKETLNALHRAEALLRSMSESDRRIAQALEAKEPKEVLEAKETLRALGAAEVILHSMSESDRQIVQALRDPPEAIRRQAERVLFEHAGGPSQA